ncbi:MAG TPA: hypothetical protein VK395_34550 [Gemmataceae bacterium]|nr:hypothetical protein [Gemmataceae bacterium]
MIIAGVVFLCAGATFLAANLAVGVGMIVVGGALIGASVVASRKADPPPDDRTVGSPTGDSGDG